MRQSLLTALFFGIVGCQPSEQTNNRQLIEAQVSRFYQETQVPQYQPVFYSPLDTAMYVPAEDGTITKLTGTLVHDYKAQAKDGTLQAYSDTFDIDVFKEQVVAIPRGY